MKMKVGDIEMTSGEGIHFDSPKPSDSTPVEPVPQWSFPDQIPGSKSALHIAATIAILGVIVTSITAFLASSYLFLIPLPGLCLFMAVALFLANRTTSSTPEDNTTLSQIDIERRTRLLTLIDQMERPLSVENIKEELQWTDEAILTTLQDLLKIESITEDLDLESGHWVYRRSDEPLVLDHQSPQALPAEERLQTLNAPQRTTS